MNREQKIAWYILIVIAAGLLLGISAILMHQFGSGVPKTAFVLATIILFCGAILSLQFISRKDKGAVTYDERDKLIEKNAYLAAFGALYLLVILVSIIPVAIAPEAKIPTTLFPGLLASAALCQGFAYSIAILVQYGWRDKGGK